MTGKTKPTRSSGEGEVRMELHSLKGLTPSDISEVNEIVGKALDPFGGFIRDEMIILSSANNTPPSNGYILSLKHDSHYNAILIVKNAIYEVLGDIGEIALDASFLTIIKTPYDMIDIVSELEHKGLSLSYFGEIKRCVTVGDLVKEVEKIVTNVEFIEAVEEAQEKPFRPGESKATEAVKKFMSDDKIQEDGPVIQPAVLNAYNFHIVLTGLGGCAEEAFDNAKETAYESGIEGYEFAVSFDPNNPNTGKLNIEITVEGGTVADVNIPGLSKSMYLTKIIDLDSQEEPSE